MDHDPKVHEVLRRASLFLEENKREAKVAELLLQHFLDVSRAQFFISMNEAVPKEILNQYNRAIAKHAETGVPLEHITGYAPFFGRDFQVSEHTLIPRPETEELIQHVMQSASNDPITIADIGTGSGVIAVTLALELPNATVYATDISEQALETAHCNADQLGAQVVFLQGDYLKPLVDHDIQADIIVSNPPYIPLAHKNLLSDTVKNFDPEQALFAGDSGLAAYKTIIGQLPETLRDDGSVFFEIGHQQGNDVQTLLQTAYPEMNVEVLTDINGKDRIVSGTG